MKSRFVVWVALSLGVVAMASAQSVDNPGLVYREVQLPGGAGGHALVVDLGRATLRVLDARDHGAEALTAREFASRSGAMAVVNASFFDVDGEPLGLLVVDGVRRNKLRPVDWGVFSIDADGADIVHTDEWKAGPGLLQAVQSGPRLLVDAVPLTLKKQSARRTALCTLADDRVEILVVPQSVLASDLATFFAAQGCTDALNLDGGPSTQLYLERAGVVVDVPGGDPVPVALGVFEVAQADIGARSGCGCK